jgi:hypothetical protein
VDRFDRLLAFSRKALLGLLISVLVLYAGDYLSVRLRMLHPKPTSPFEDVILQRLISISEKGQKQEYVPADPQTVTCVHALFPHMGYDPCWYIRQLNQKPIQE